MKRMAFITLATIGVLVVLAEIVLHVIGAIRPALEYEVNHTVLIVGAAMGFVGLYHLDPKTTKELVTVASGVVPRFFGRRSTDAVAIPEAETTIRAVPVPTKPTDTEQEG